MRRIICRGWRRIVSFELAERWRGGVKARLGPRGVWVGFIVMKFLDASFE